MYTSLEVWEARRVSGTGLLRFEFDLLIGAPTYPVPREYVQMSKPVLSLRSTYKDDADSGFVFGPAVLR